METDKKLYVAIAVLAVLGGVFYLQRGRVEAERASYTLEGQTADLPELGATDDKINAITRVVIKAPADGEKPAQEVELKKEGNEWKLERPVKAKANQVNVGSLLNALKSIKASERIDPSTKNYASFKLTEDTALRATFYAGDQPSFDLYFGQDGSRGQMARIGKHDGVYAVKGYSSYLFKREPKGWRDLNLMQFDSNQVARVQIENENGTFTFERTETAAKPAQGAAGAAAAPEPTKSWTAQHKKAKSPIGLALKGFEPSKVDDVVRAYSSLNAVDFTVDKKPEEVGLANPEATVRFFLKDGAQKVVEVGKTSEGSNRWARAAGSSEIFSISSWAADWAAANEEKFKKSEDKPDEAADKGEAPATGMPHGMPGMPHDDDH